jgi:hypothetical protein
MPWEFGMTFDLKNLRLLTYDDILLKDSHEAVLKMVVEQLVDVGGLYLFDSFAILWRMACLRVTRKIYAPDY